MMMHVSLWFSFLLSASFCSKVQVNDSENVMEYYSELVEYKNTLESCYDAAITGFEFLEGMDLETLEYFDRLVELKIQNSLFLYVEKKIELQKSINLAKATSTTFKVKRNRRNKKKNINGHVQHLQNEFDIFLSTALNKINKSEIDESIIAEYNRIFNYLHYSNDEQNLFPIERELLAFAKIVKSQITFHSQGVEICEEIDKAMDTICTAIKKDYLSFPHLWMSEKGDFLPNVQEKDDFPEDLNVGGIQSLISEVSENTFKNCPHEEIKRLDQKLVNFNKDINQLILSGDRYRDKFKSYITKIFKKRGILFQSIDIDRIRKYVEEFFRIQFPVRCNYMLCSDNYREFDKFSWSHMIESHQNIIDARIGEIEKFQDFRKVAIFFIEIGNRDIFYEHLKDNKHLRRAFKHGEFKDGKFKDVKYVLSSSTSSSESETITVSDFSEEEISKESASNESSYTETSSVDKIDFSFSMLTLNAQKFLFPNIVQSNDKIVHDEQLQLFTEVFDFLTEDDQIETLI